MWCRCGRWDGLEVVSEWSKRVVESVHKWNIAVCRSRGSRHTGVLNSGELSPLLLIRSCRSSTCRSRAPGNVFPVGFPARPERIPCGVSRASGIVFPVAFPARLETYSLLGFPRAWKRTGFPRAWWIKTYGCSTFWEIITSAFNTIVPFLDLHSWKPCVPYELYEPYEAHEHYEPHWARLAICAL